MDIVKSSERRDRLSELPDSLILVILSLLQMRDVVMTTILSKRWKNLWTRVPCLRFWHHSYHLHEFRRFIYAALAQWEGPKLLNFTINFTYFLRGSIHYLDSWLLFAIEKQVEELSLHLGNFRQHNFTYCPPQPLYSCSSITKLSVYYLKLIVEETVQWDRLKSLTVVGLDSSSADAMNRLLCGAPCLEELILCNSHISENFNIRSTSLKTLCIGIHVSHLPDEAETVDVYAGRELRIWAPNLLTFKIRARMNGRCYLDVPSLTNAVLDFEDCLFQIDLWHFRYVEMLHQVFQSVCHVESVTLSSLCIKFLLYMKREKNRVVQFSNAKFLNLCNDEGGVHQRVDVLDMFPKLMTMQNVEGPRSRAPEKTLSLCELLDL